MLMFERKVGQGFRIGGIASVRITEFRKGNRVKVAVDAPREIPILRDELVVDPGERPSAFRDLRIFCVEDDDDFASMLELAISMHGVGSVSRAADAAEAERRLEAAISDPEAEPSMVLVDYHLPGGSGLSVVRWLREHRVLRRLPVIVLSGENDDRCIDSCLQAGANAFIAKPDDFTGLADMLGHLLSFWSAPALIRS